MPDCFMPEMPSTEPATSVRALCQTASGVSIVVEHQCRTVSEVVHHLGHGLIFMNLILNYAM